MVVQDLVYQPGANLLLPERPADVPLANSALFALPSMVPIQRAIDGEFDRYIARHGASLPKETAIFPRGDANCNGTIDSGDVVLVLRAAVGLANSGACVGTIR